MILIARRIKLYSAIKGNRRGNKSSVRETRDSSSVLDVSSNNDLEAADS